MSAEAPLHHIRMQTFGRAGQQVYKAKCSCGHYESGWKAAPGYVQSAGDAHCRAKNKAALKKR